MPLELSIIFCGRDMNSLDGKSSYTQTSKIAVYVLLATVSPRLQFLPYNEENNY